MAPKSKKDETDPLAAFGDPLADPGSDLALDQAIDDLRGVMKADQEGGLPDLGGGDFGTEFGGGDFGGGDLGGGLGGGLGDDFGAGFGQDQGTGFGGSDFSAGGSMAAPGSALNANLDLIMDIPIDVEIILGSSRMQVSGLMNLSEGSIIPLDRKIGEPVDLIVNGRLIGRGEITVLENDETRFGVRLLEVTGRTK